MDLVMEMIILHYLTQRSDMGELELLDQNRLQLGIKELRREFDIIE